MYTLNDVNIQWLLFYKVITIWRDFLIFGISEKLPESAFETNFFFLFSAKAPIKTSTYIFYLKLFIYFKVMYTLENITGNFIK